MNSFFLACAIVGGGTLLIQLVLGAFGLEGGHDLGHGGLEHGGEAPGHEGARTGSAAGSGLNLFSVRSLTAGLAFFGLTGLAALHGGWPWLLALLVAVVPGLAAMILVAWAMRSFRRLESDGSLDPWNAVGSGATVYIPIPQAESAPGKITFSLQNRTVEYDAVTRGAALPTGTDVTIVDVREDGVLEVVPTPNPLPEVS